MIDLAEVLFEMRRQGVEIVFRGGEARVPEDTAPALLARMCAVRPHLIRLAESDAGLHGLAAWREQLRIASEQVREAWALVAYGHEAQGLLEHDAEWQAWEDIGYGLSTRG